MKILGLGLPELIILAIIIAIIVTIVKKRNKPANNGNPTYGIKDPIDTRSYKQMTVKREDNDDYKSV